MHLTYATESLAMVFVETSSPISLGLTVYSHMAFAVGFDAETLTFTFAGSPDSRLAVTAKADIARSLAQLALLALVSSSVPNVVRIAGQNVSYREIGQAAERVREERELKPKNVTLKAIDLEAYKAATREEQVRTGVSDLHKHIKYGMLHLLPECDD